MTREEAISLIKSVQLMLVNPTTNEPVSDLYEALEMAISALKQEPCEDAISRETVVNTLQYAWEANKDIQESIVEIKALPSVTPSRQVIKDIKNEIKSHIIESNGLDFNSALYIALEIIDNYTKESSGAEMENGK